MLGEKETVLVFMEKREKSVKFCEKLIYRLTGTYINHRYLKDFIKVISQVGINIGGVHNCILGCFNA